MRARARGVQSAIVLLAWFLAATAVVPLRLPGNAADALLGVQGAQAMLETGPRWFLAAGRVGALSSYLTLPWVVLLGPTSAAWAAGALTCAALLLLALWVLGRAAFAPADCTLAVLALVFCAPGVVHLAILLPGYGEAATATALWCAWVVIQGRAGRGRGADAESGTALAGAAIVFLGVWSSLIVWGPVAAGLAWLAWRRRIGWRAAGLVAAAGLLASAPQIWFHAFSYEPRRVRVGLPRWDLIAPTVAHTVLRRVPLLFAPGEAIPPAGRGLATFALAGLYGAATLAAARRILRRRVLDRATEGRRESTLVFGGMAVATLALSLVTSAAQGRGDSAWRYLLPMAIPVAALMALWLVSLPRRVAWAAACLLAVLNVPVAGSVRRAGLDAARDAERMALLDAVREAGAPVALGGYWDVYPLGYLSGGRVPGLPCDPVGDYFGLESRTPATWGRWAVWGRAGDARLDEMARAQGDLVADLRRGPTWRALIVRSPAGSGRAEERAAVLARFRRNCQSP